MMMMMVTICWLIRFRSQVQWWTHPIEMNTNHDDSQWGWWWWQLWWWRQCIDWLTFSCPGLYQVTWSLYSYLASGEWNIIYLYKWVDSDQCLHNHLMRIWWEFWSPTQKAANRVKSDLFTIWLSQQCCFPQLFYFPMRIWWECWWWCWW